MTEDGGSKVIAERLRAVVELRDKYSGQTAWIVGKGPSLAHLRADHFTDSGPVMTMNEAILIVQKLGIPNTIYSMQKDGCHMDPDIRCTVECQMHWPMVYPDAEVTAILQDPGFSQECLPRHEKKLWVDPVRELKFHEATEMSVLMCIRLAKIMGCVKIHLVSCDSLAGDYRTIDVHTLQSAVNGFSGHYAYVVPQVREALKGFPHAIILPRGGQ